MGNPKRTYKQNSNSESNKPSASTDLKIKKTKPKYPEDYMELSNEVDRDTLAENVGSHRGDTPETSSLASVPRTEGDYSDSETSSKGHRNLGKDDRPTESDEEGKVREPDALNLTEPVGLDFISLEQRVRNSLRSNQRFLFSCFRFDEVIELTNARIRNHIDELLQVLLANQVLNDSEKRLLSVTNGHLIPLRLTLSDAHNSGIDEDFICNEGYANTHAYNIMMHRIKAKNLSNRQPYPQGHILSRTTSSPASSSEHDREIRFIVGVIPLRGKCTCQGRKSKGLNGDD